MKRIFGILLLVVVLGCSSSQTQHPPLYSRGDTVRIDGTDALGIILSNRYYFGEWIYEVMTSAEKPIDYQEDFLVLEKRAVWHSAKEVKAEIESIPIY
jgi:hypothetical protein